MSYICYILTIDTKLTVFQSCRNTVEKSKVADILLYPPFISHYSTLHVCHVSLYGMIRMNENVK